MNRIVIIILTAVFLVSCTGSGATSLAQREQQALQEIMQMERKFVAAYMRKDIETLDQILGDEYRVVFPNGKKVTKKDILAKLKDETIRIELIALEEIDFRLSGNVGVLSGYANINAIVDGDKFNGWYRGITLVEKKEGKWKLVDEYFATTEYRPKKKASSNKE